LCSLTRSHSRHRQLRPRARNRQGAYSKVRAQNGDENNKSIIEGENTSSNTLDNDIKYLNHEKKRNKNDVEIVQIEPRNEEKKSEKHRKKTKKNEKKRKKSEKYSETLSDDDECEA